MYKIFKYSNHPTVDFAAEELKKYLRMMMPRCGEIEITTDERDGDGFVLHFAPRSELNYPKPMPPSLMTSLLSTRTSAAESLPRATRVRF